MVHVWYVQYGDTAHNIDPTAIYEQVLAEIKAQDPTAYIEEIRQYQNQIAFLVNHPSWTTSRMRPLIIWVLIPIILVAIAAVLVSAGYLINTMIGWEKEHRTYVDKDPDTGETVQIYGWDAYLAWLASNKPEALQNLQNYNATNWWEQITSWLPIIVALIGVAIFIPLISKLIPGGGMKE